jgi:hypothetical protein
MGIIEKIFGKKVFDKFEKKVEQSLIEQLKKEVKL